jgi:hypothetical protein
LPWERAVASVSGGLVVERVGGLLKRGRDCEREPEGIGERERKRDVREVRERKRGVLERVRRVDIVRFGVVFDDCGEVVGT